MNATKFKVCVFSSPSTGNLVQFRLSPEQQAEADRLGITHLQHAKALYRQGLALMDRTLRDAGCVKDAG